MRHGDGVRRGHEVRSTDRAREPVESVIESVAIAIVIVIVMMMMTEVPPERHHADTVIDGTFAPIATEELGVAAVAV